MAELSDMTVRSDRTASANADAFNLGDRAQLPIRGQLLLDALPSWPRTNHQNNVCELAVPISESATALQQLGFSADLNFIGHPHSKFPEALAKQLTLLSSSSIQ
jgi:hypothetical protein